MKRNGAIARNSVSVLTVVEEKRASNAKPSAKILVEFFRSLSHFLNGDTVSIDTRQRYPKALEVSPRQGIY